jgi:hypothetical protein
MTIKQSIPDPAAEPLGEPNIEAGAVLSDLVAKRAKKAPAHQPVAKKASAPEPTCEGMNPAPKAKRAAPKARNPKAAIERVPAETVLALLAELKLTKTQLAQATGKSNSLVSEWVGKGRGRLVSTADWAAYEVAARKFAKEGTK